MNTARDDKSWTRPLWTCYFKLKQRFVKQKSCAHERFESYNFSESFRIEFTANSLERESCFINVYCKTSINNNKKGMLIKKSNLAPKCFIWGASDASVASASLQQCIAYSHTFRWELFGPLNKQPLQACTVCDKQHDNNKPSWPHTHTHTNLQARLQRRFRGHLCNLFLWVIVQAPVLHKHRVHVAPMAGRSISVVLFDSLDHSCERSRVSR